MLLPDGCAGSRTDRRFAEDTIARIAACNANLRYYALRFNMTNRFVVL